MLVELHEQILSHHGDPLYWIYVTIPQKNGQVHFEGNCLWTMERAVEYKALLREKHSL